MQNSSCGKPDETGGASTITWCAQTVDWPYERAVVQVTVVVPRELAPLEWALSRALEEFKDDPPTLVETATELGIKDPLLLVETLQELIELGAAEPRNGQRPGDLTDFRLTRQGRELLARGQIASLPERHGMHLIFDALTGEHVCHRPPGARAKPEVPIMGSEALPERVQELGLDRVRRLASDQKEPFQLNEVRILQSTVRYEEGGHLWQSMRMELGICPDGVLRIHLCGGSESQQAFLDQGDAGLALFAGLSRVSTGDWANGHCVPHTPIPAKGWVGLAERPVDPSQTAKEACNLVQAAQQEVIAQAGWLDAPDFESHLNHAASRGVRCLTCSGSGSGVPMAVIADNIRGLRVDTVSVQTPSGKPLHIEIATTVKASQLPALRQELLSAKTQALSAADQPAQQIRDAAGEPKSPARPTDVPTRRAS